MFPLKTRKLIRGAAAHVKAGLGIAADYQANYVPLYTPFAGKIETYWGHDGGNWLRLIRPNGDRLEFAHLSKYLQTGGTVSEGEQIAVTGNTGAITDYPHLHVQIFKDGKRFDPEAYQWTPMQMNIKVFSNVTWNPDIHLIEARNLLKEWSGVDVSFQVEQVSYEAIPISPFGQFQAPDVNWYRENITPKAEGYDASILLIPYSQWPGVTFGIMMWNDPGKPIRIAVAANEHELIGDIEKASIVIVHELAHAFGHLTGVPDEAAVVHSYHDFKQKNDLPGFFKTINYQVLAEKLGQEQEMIKRQRVPGGTQYLNINDKLLVGIASTKFAALLDQANVIIENVQTLPPNVPEFTCDDVGNNDSIFVFHRK